MIDELLKGSNNSILQRGDLRRVADIYQQHRKTVSKFWREQNKQKAACVQSPDLHNRQKGNIGQKEGVDITALVELLKEIPLKNRTTVRSIAAALNVPRSTLFRNLEKLVLRSSSRFLKPLLTDTGAAAQA